MSKPVKTLVRKELISRFEGHTSLAVVGFTGLGAVENNKIRGRLLAKGMRLSVVKNVLAKQAFKELGLEEAGQMLDGPCAVAYGGDSVVDLVRELLDIGKEAPTLTVKAALLDGEIYGSDRIVEQAIATIVTCALSPARNIAGCLIGPASKIAGILKTIEENSEGDPAESEAAPDAPAESEAAPDAPAETDAAQDV